MDGKPGKPRLSDDLTFMLSVMEEAGARAMKYFDTGISVSRKGDGSPVTIADREVESLIRSAIESRYPDDGILGEEEEEKTGGSGARRWIIDPIDGTMNFSRGIPIFSILMALEKDDDIVAGAVYNPAGGDLYYAESGAGAYKNHRRIKASAVDSLSDALMIFGAPDRILEAGLWEGFTNLVRSTYKQRGLGDYLGFALVFEGKAEANIEVGLKPWDLAPMKILARESGALFLDLEGGTSIYQGSCVVANAVLGREFYRRLKASEFTLM